jgi:hypothetical protein
LRDIDRLLDTVVRPVKNRILFELRAVIGSRNYVNWVLKLTSLLYFSNIVFQILDHLEAILFRHLVVYDYCFDWGFAELRRNRLCVDHLCCVDQGRSIDEELAALGQVQLLKEFLDELQVDQSIVSNKDVL